MSTMSLEEIRRRLAEVPVEEFGCSHFNCAMGQLHYILTGRVSSSYYCNIYPPDVTHVVTSFNDNLDPEDRKALAMMLPLPEAFPALTPAHALKLALWAGEQALSHYTGPGREVLEQAVALARRAAAGEAFTEEEADAIVAAALTIKRNAEFSEKWWTAHVLLCTVSALVAVVRLHSSSDASATVANAVRVSLLTGIDWREWLAEYLKVRTEA